MRYVFNNARRTTNAEAYQAVCSAISMRSSLAAVDTPSHCCCKCTRDRQGSICNNVQSDRMKQQTRRRCRVVPAAVEFVVVIVVAAAAALRASMMMIVLMMMTAREQLLLDLLVFVFQAAGLEQDDDDTTTTCYSSFCLFVSRCKNRKNTNFVV